MNVLEGMFRVGILSPIYVRSSSENSAASPRRTTHYPILFRDAVLLITAYPVGSCDVLAGRVAFFSCFLFFPNFSAWAR